MKIRKVICDKKGFRKQIGQQIDKRQPRYWEGTYQTGYKSCCSEKHLEDSLTKK